MLLTNKHFHSCLRKITSAHKTTDTGADYYGIINIIVRLSQFIPLSLAI